MCRINYALDRGEAPARCYGHGATFAMAAVLACLLGCTQEMEETPRFEPYETQAGALEPPPGAMPRGHLQLDDHFYRGLVEGEPAETFPEPITREALVRGRRRYNIFCAPCHDLAGKGEGYVVRRGFPAPPSFHIDRLREAPPGHIFRVITHGRHEMPAYGARIPPADRWAIVAYLRALQRSQNADPSELPTNMRND